MLNAPMNIRTLRMKHSKKAVTPVIATIILIAATIVLALVVGAYTFGLFGSNVKTVTLTSATLYGGNPSNSTATYTATSSLVLSLNNPGSASYITSLTLTGTGLANPIQYWCSDTAVESSGNLISFASSGAYNAMSGGKVSSYTFYPTSGTTTAGVGD